MKTPGSSWIVRAVTVVTACLSVALADTAVAAAADEVPAGLLSPADLGDNWELRGAGQFDALAIPDFGVCSGATVWQNSIGGTTSGSVAVFGYTAARRADEENWEIANLRYRLTPEQTYEAANRMSRFAACVRDGGTLPSQTRFIAPRGDWPSWMTMVFSSVSDGIVYNYAYAIALAGTNLVYLQSTAVPYGPDGLDYWQGVIITARQNCLLYCG